MDPARWEHVQALFHRAADLTEAERTAFLQGTCAADPSLLADVRRMLQEDAQTSLLDRDVTEVAAGVFGDALTASFQEFSPYRIKSVLGEGGMGVVYLAERKDLGNLVAIKILRDGWLSPARRERFTAEQRTLAQLNHPSIARLYDASTLPDGTPWFVMEYVEGVPITDYCRAHNSAPDERVKLIRAVAEAVQHAHSHGIIHRDLKPSNILVKADGSLRLLDFGIAKQLDTTGRPVNPTRTAFRPMTPAYASPEQLRGEPVGGASDVYSLGVVLYELLAGKLPAAQDPANPTAVRRLDTVCRAAIEKDATRRYATMAAFIADIDHYLNQEPLEARAGFWPRPLARLVRRNSVAALAAVTALALAALALDLSRKTVPPLAPARTVAVLPFLNRGADPNLDYLSQALPDEIARALEYARSLSLRPTDATRKYTGENRSIQKIGRELHVATVVSGHYLKAGDQLQVTLDVTDVESNRLLWSDVFDFPAQNMVAMQAQIAVKTRRSMAPVLGVSEFVTERLPKPKNDEAYQLFLRATAIAADAAASPEAKKRSMDMLNQSIALDPTYGPAWMALGSWYTMDAWFGPSGAAAFARWCELADKGLALDPDNFTFRAHMLYLRSLVRYAAARSGGISRGQAYRELQDLLRIRPDSARVHFMMSWLLRDTGLLEEAAHECETSILIDAQEAGARSCGVAFMLRGEYQRALDYLRLDPSSEVAKSVSIDVLLREGKPDEAAQKASEKLPQWGAYDVLLAYLQHRPGAEIAELAAKVEPAVDPEVNYFSAAHLAYAGQSDAALAMLRRTIEDGYCAYPGMDSDPMFTGLRSKPKYAEVRAAGLACQDQFLAQREKAARPQ